MLPPEQNELQQSFTSLSPKSWKSTSAQNKLCGRLLKRLINTGITKTLKHQKVFGRLLCSVRGKSTAVCGRTPELTEPQTSLTLAGAVPSRDATSQPMEEKGEESSARSVHKIQTRPGVATRPSWKQAGLQESHSHSGTGPWNRSRIL